VDEKPDAPSGKDYLEAATSAGQRSRAIISVVLILMVFTFTALRNNYEPAWNYTLIQVYEDLHDCLTQNNLGDPKCVALKDRVEKIQGRPARAEDVVPFADDIEIELRGQYEERDFLSRNDSKIRELEIRYKALIAKDAENEVISIPVLGSQINFNDLWLVSGVLMFCLLYALRASLEQEYRNARFIVERKPLYANLLSMNQVLSLQSDANLIARIIQGIVWIAPSCLYLYLFYSDCVTYPYNVAIVGQLRTIVEYFLEGGAVFLVIFQNVQCLRAQYKLQKLLGSA
jgi:hypothetical protein